MDPEFGQQQRALCGPEQLIRRTSWLTKSRATVAARSWLAASRSHSPGNSSAPRLTPRSNARGGCSLKLLLQGVDLVRMDLVRLGQVRHRRLLSNRLQGDPRRQRRVGLRSRSLHDPLRLSRWNGQRSKHSCSQIRGHFSGAIVSNKRQKRSKRRKATVHQIRSSCLPDTPPWPARNANHLAGSLSNGNCRDAHLAE